MNVARLSPRRARARLTRGVLVVVLGIACACHRRPAAAAPPVQVVPAPRPPNPDLAPVPPPPRRDGDGACARDADAEGIVGAEIVRRVEEARAQSRARARVTFICTPIAPGNGTLHVDGLRAHGHGGNAVLVSLELARDGAGDVRSVRLTPERSPVLGAPPPLLGVARAHVDAERARKALSLVRAALGARIEIDLPAPVAGQTQSVSVRATTHHEHIELAIRGADAPGASDYWEGYVNSLDEQKRAPLDIAWKALADLLPTTFTTDAPASEDKLLFSRVWKSGTRRGDWVDDALLGFAASLGDAGIAPSATAALGSPHVHTKILAVNALAAATGRDVRRNAAGKPRPLADVVADYQRGQGTKPAEQTAPRP